MDSFSRACYNFSLTICTKKLCTSLHFESPNNRIINNRIAKTNTAFGRLRKNVRERRNRSLTTKLKASHAVVLTTLYASETWIVYTRHAKQLNYFYLSCLCRLLDIRW